MSVSASEKITAVEKYIASYNASDVEGIVSIFADNASIEDPVGTPLLHGIAAVGEFMQAGVSMGAKLKLLGPVRCAGDYAAFPFEAELNMEGQPTRIEIIDIFKFNDAGKVAEMRAFWGPENMENI